MKKILVIDDDESLLKMMGELLTRSGYEVIQAVDGNQGLRQFYATHPDLVITDIIMPDKEGLEVIMELHKQTPRPKIIAISGGGKLKPESYLPLAERLGADHILEKPFLPKELITLIKDLLSP
jgi:DNA-binding response OmpR family regulator